MKINLIKEGPTADHYSGAVNELIVSKHYLMKGYNVFTPIMQHGMIDLIVDKPTGLERVQVKTAYLNGSSGGPYKYIQCRLNQHGRMYPPDAFDTLAVVLGARIWEIPFSEVWQSNICLGRIPAEGYKPKGTSFMEYEVT